jgi:hypothetical protein
MNEKKKEIRYLYENDISLKKCTCTKILYIRLKDPIEHVIYTKIRSLWK